LLPILNKPRVTLEKSAPGRIDLDIGTGFNRTEHHGLGAMRLADLREYVRVVRALLAGETVEWDFEWKRRNLRNPAQHLASRLARTASTPSSRCGSPAPEKSPWMLDSASM
jgi:alkanesulfonate monooxygenase SsuD/methylene tetrahydromethanopterin reductase-like flavin-dependent oxidoreductase (luciferase family)